MMNATPFYWLLAVVANLLVSVESNWITGNLCWSMPCLNGGSCFGSAYTYLCVCPINYSGALCEKRLGICQESPCGNRGLCVETGSTSFECRCYFDYMGPLCEEHVPKNDPSVWSSLIPVHTRVLFDILQEAYRVKIDGKSPGAVSHLAPPELVEPLIKNDPSPFLSSSSSFTTTTTTLPSIEESTLSLYPSESTESAPVIRADNIQLEKIFPQISTVPTSTTEGSTVSADTSTIDETTTSNELTNESTMATSLATEITSMSTAVSTKDLSTVETATESLTTAITEQMETPSSSITEDQHFSNATETSPVLMTSAPDPWSTYNSTNEAIPKSTDTMVDTTPPVTEIVTNATEMDSLVINSTWSIDDSTASIINASSTETEAIQDTSFESTAATAPIMTTEQLLPVEGLLEALNNSETLRNQLLYKLCRQLLSHILPNASSSSSAAATARALDLVSNSSITMNHTANALLSWIQEQLASSSSTSTTAATTTATTSSSTRSSLQSLLVKATELPSTALQRVDMDEVLAYANANADGELSS